MGILLFAGRMFSNGISCNLPFPSCFGRNTAVKDNGSDELLPKMGNEPVILNVYDMVSDLGIWTFGFSHCFCFSIGSTIIRTL